MDLGKIDCNWSPATLSKKDTHCARRLLKLTKHLLLLQPVLETKAKEELKGKDLICWCAPERCHAEILLKYAN